MTTKIINFFLSTWHVLKSLCTSPVRDGGSESIIISHTIPDQSATSTSNDSSELLDITFREHRIYKEKLQMEALQQSINNDMIQMEAMHFLFDSN